MNTNTKLFITFIGGATIGSLISFVYLKDKFEHLAKEEIEAMKEYYQKEFEDMENAYDSQLDELLEVITEEDNDIYDEEEEDNDIYDEEEDNDISNELDKIKEKYVDYAKKYKTPQELVEEKFYGPNEDNIYDEEEDDEDLDLETELYYEGRRATETNAAERALNPHVISRREFEEEYQHFDKLTITYYAEDATLADERDDVIPDIAEVITWEALDRFGALSDDPNIVHVRNARLGADFEVCRVEGSYNEEVLGIFNDIQNS